VLQRLLSLQVKRPAIPLGIALLLTVIAAAYALRLHVQTGFESLLPESRDSVKELKRVTSLTNGVSTVYVVVEGGPKTPVSALRQAADALVPVLQKVGEPYVATAESGVHEAVKYLGPRSGLYLTREKLEALEADIQSRYSRAVSQATGLFIELDEAEKPAEQIDFASFKRDLTIEGVDPSRYPDGYYQSPDGHSVVVLIRSKVNGGEFDKGSEALRRIRAAVNGADLSRFDPDLKVGYAGDLATAVSEFEAVNQDLLDVGVFGASLVAAVVLAYFIRLRTLALMLITIGVGVAWTFGVTELTIGRLNIATGFLFTIVTGNGINFGIIYMARYLEARRSGVDSTRSLQIAGRETWLPTLTAGAAAGASYGSLAATDFRGFHDFGFIGGLGMLLCWIATYWVLPPLLVVTERYLPLHQAVADGAPLSLWQRMRRAGGNFGAPFVWLVSRFPGTIAVGGLLVSLAGGAATVHWAINDPMEYDLHAMRTDATARANEMRLDMLGNDVTGHVGAGGMAILVQKTEQIPLLREALLARRDAAPADLKPFKGLHALQDFVPAGQEEKIPVLLRIRTWLLKARARHAISDADWKELQVVLPPEILTPFSMADLPDSVARPFTETDGTRGRIVFISPTSHTLVDDAHYLFRWADSYRRTELPDGAVILGSGRAVIYADMWSAVVEDVPKAVLLSFFGTVLVVLLAFRKGRASLAVVGSLVIGVAWMGGALVLLDVRLNFLNFIALPITFGIGVDYAVNVVQRYIQEGRGSALLAIKETGGAVVLCSMTTMLGYLALVRSANFGVRSLGVAAFIGEICCLLVSVLVLPAVLVLLDRRRPAAPTRAAEH
jgi:predicted RND superfamily exporter protein